MEISRSTLAKPNTDLDGDHTPEKIAIKRDDDSSDGSEYETGDSSDESEYESGERSDDSEHETDDNSDDSYSETDERFDLPYPDSTCDLPIKPYYSAEYPEFNQNALQKYNRLLLFAINDFNRILSNEKLELVNLLKVNREPERRMYYFTFLAKVVSSGETKTYYSKVHDPICLFIGAKVLTFREKRLGKDSSRLGSLVQERDNSYKFEIDSGDVYAANTTGRVSSDDRESDPDMRDQLSCYTNHIRASDGFDLPFVPDSIVVSSSHPIQPYFHADIPGYECLQGMDALSYAINHHNQREVPKLELVKVLKLNINYWIVKYYFTFLAKDVNTGEIKKYQTKVHSPSRSEVGYIVMIFREKVLNQGESMLEAGEKSSRYWRSSDWSYSEDEY